MFAFLRGVPLDGSRLRLPGGLNAWRIAPSESETEVIARLAQARPRASCGYESDLSSLLEVLRIDRRRERALDEASVRLLSENACSRAAAYPYLAVLSGLSEADFRQFFAFAESMDRRNEVELNRAMGQWHALVALLCRAQQLGALGESAAAALFRIICGRFTRARSPADFTSASLDAVREILRAAVPGATDPDEAVRNLLLGPGPGPAEFSFAGANYKIDPATARRENYARVLDAQKAPALAPLLRIYDAARKIEAAGRVAGESKSIEEDLQRIPVVEFRPRRLTGGRARNLASYRADTALRTARALADAGGGPAESLARDLVGQLQAPVTWALAGTIYAALLNAEDVLVSDDPAFLRKHEYVSLRGVGRPDLFPEPALSEGAGSLLGSVLTGGFADLSAMAGAVGCAGQRSGDISPTAVSVSEGLRSQQLGSIRMTDYGKLDDDDLRLFALIVRAAREWIVEAAADPVLRAGLAESALGLVSLRRRADLLKSLEAGDWPTVWDTLTLSDLYFLGSRYFDRYKTDPVESPVISAARDLLAKHGRPRMDELIGSRAEPAPYEDFDRYLFPARLHERLSELKLYVADLMVSSGIPAATFTTVAEPVGREVFRNLQMADPYDWRSAIAAFAGMDRGAQERALAR
jgi:hypothetical protein